MEWPSKIYVEAPQDQYLRVQLVPVYSKVILQKDLVTVFSRNCYTTSHKIHQMSGSGCSNGKGSGSGKPSAEKKSTGVKPSADKKSTGVKPFTDKKSTGVKPSAEKKSTGVKPSADKTTSYCGPSMMFSIDM